MSAQCRAGAWHVATRGTWQSGGSLLDGAGTFVREQDRRLVAGHARRDVPAISRCAASTNARNSGQFTWDQVTDRLVHELFH